MNNLTPKTPLSPSTTPTSAKVVDNTKPASTPTPAKPKFTFGQSSTNTIIGMIYGDAGVGKTHLASTFPNPYFVLFEDGTKTIRGSNAKWPQNDEGKPLVCKDLATAEEIISELLTLEDCKTIVIDSVTEIDKLLFAKNTKLEDQGTAKSKNSWGFKYTETTNEQAEFANKLVNLCTKYNKHLIFLAHSELKKINKPEHDGQISIDKVDIRFYGTPKTGFYYTSICDFVAYISEATVMVNNKRVNVPEKRTLNMYDNFNATAKNRFGVTKTVDYKLGENPILPLYEKEKK